MPYPALPLAEAHRILTAPGSPSRPSRARSAASGCGSGRTRRRPCATCSVSAAASATRRSWSTRTSAPRFEAFARAAVVFAHELQSLGIVKGDRVAIGMRNLPEWPVAFFGTILAGAIAVPLNAWSTGPELEFVLDDSGARLAVARRRALSTASRRISTPARPCALSSSAARNTLDCGKAEAWEKLIGKTADWANLPAFDLPEVDLAPDDDATIFYTSGTTGKPEGRARHASQRLLDAVRAALRPGDGGAATWRHAGRARSERAAEIDAAVRALLPRHRLHVDADPGARLRREDRHHAPLGHGRGAETDRARAHQRRRRRADHRLATDRASRLRQIRHLLAGKFRLRRRAGGGRLWCGG